LDINNIKKTGANGKSASKEELKENYINNIINKPHGGYREGSGRKKKDKDKVSKKNKSKKSRGKKSN
jgi:hypothetical protein